MATDTPTETSSIAQHAMIRSLLRDAEVYDDRTVTLMHRRLGVPDKFQGQPVEVWLGSLSKREASEVITKLQAELEE
jgi:hypothetical protein